MKMRVTLGDWVFDTAEYDRDRDVLYLSMGGPRPAEGVETPEGHILRYDESDVFCAVTLIGVQGLLDRGQPVNVTMSTPDRQVDLGSSDLHRVLAC